MDKIFSTLDQKIKTKEDLNLYLEGVSLAKRAIDDNNFNPEELEEKVKTKVKEIFSYLENKERLLIEDKESLQEKKDKLKEEEKEKRNQKEELEHLIEKEENFKKKEELKKEKRNLEKERRKKEEEIWALEDKISDLEIKIDKAKNNEDEGENNLEERLSILNKMEEHLFSLPEIRLQLAIKPTEETIIKIRNWFKKELGRLFVLNMEVKPELVGGVTVECNGKWGDFSLAKEMKKIDYPTLSKTLYE